MNNQIKQTHESYIHAVRSIAVQYALQTHDMPQRQINDHVPLLSDEQIEAIQHAKLVYGRGHITLRGVTQYGAWNNGRSRVECPHCHQKVTASNGKLDIHAMHSPDSPASWTCVASGNPAPRATRSDELVEVCALGEESWEQLAGTTIHELAHVASGLGAGHSRLWKQNCVALGLRRALAGGTKYTRAMFAPEVRHALAALPLPEDGLPKAQMDALGRMVLARPCAAGIGTRGGKSVGPGSGRLRKYACEHGQIIRASTDHLEARCLECGFPFALQHPDAARYVSFVEQYL